MGNSAALGRFPRAGRGPRSAVLLRVASDERLVALVRGGSEAAFEAIYDRHHRGILAFSRHMLSSADEAEDAVQHTFMAAYRHLVGGAAEIQLRPWLYTIARNRCLSMLRARRERPLDELHAAGHRAPVGRRRNGARTSASCSATSRRCPRTSGPRWCSPSSAPSRTTRSPRCSTSRGRR